jgi:hypothetical protein
LPKCRGNGLDLAVEAGLRPADSPGPGDVRVRLEVGIAPLPRARRGAAASGLEIYGYAIDGDGRIAGFFDATLPLEADPRDTAPTISYEASLALAPGTYDLRVLVRESSQGATATRAQALEVPGTP